MIADLLQALEHTVEEVRRLSQVVSTLIEAQQSGRTLPAGTLATYAEQLQTADRQREEMERMIAVFWQQIGRTETQ